MKVKFLLLASVLVSLFFSACQNDNEPKEISKAGTEGNCRIEIVGEKLDSELSRSSSGTIQFVGGTASGAGLYDGNAKATVSATPDAGYEIDYFYGGPTSEPKKYDSANGGASSFKVEIGGQDHLFHVGFKEKTRTLTVNAASGGSATGSGTYKCDTPVQITATPQSGYTFAGWEINEGDVTIADKSNAKTTATLNSLNSTITALFDKVIPKEYVTVRVSFNSNFSATVTASGTEITGEKSFTGQSGTFKVLKGGTVTIRVMRGTITFDGEEYPAAGIDNINVWGSSSIIVSEKNTWTVTFPANDNMMSVEVHCYTGGNLH